jgi:hypothetical protein
MPVDDKSAKKELTFALAIVKASVISDHAESSRIRSALQVMLPGVSVILVAEDDELSSYRSRRDLSDFAKDAQCTVMRSSRICAN